MRALVTLPAKATVDEICDVIRTDGGVLVEGMLNSDLIAAFMADLQPYLDRTPWGEEYVTGNRTRRCSSLLAKSMHTAQMLTQDQFLGAAEKLIGSDEEFEFWMGDIRESCRPSIQLSVSQVIQLWPGQQRQGLHRDDSIHHRQHPGPDSQVQVIYAMSEFTQDNGATLVIPGSHLWDNERKPSLQDAVPAVMKRGSGLIYLGSTYHAGGENCSDEPRTAVAISLLAGYLRQEETQYLAVPKEIVKRFPTKVQELIGYKLSPPHLGWVEMVSPSIVLEGGDYSTVMSKPVKAIFQ